MDLTENNNNQYQENNSINTKINNILLNKGWNDQNEYELFMYREKTFSYKWMHEKNGYILKIRHLILNISLVSLSGIASLIESLVPNSDSIIYLNIIKKVILYIITLLSILHNFIKTLKISERHYQTSKLLSKLHNIIHLQCCLNRNERINASIFMKKIYKEYDSLLLSGPNISNYIVNQYNKSKHLIIHNQEDEYIKLQIEKSKSTIIQNDINNTLNDIPNNTLNDIPNNILNDTQNDDSEILELNKKLYEFEYQRYLQNTDEYD